MRIERWYFLIVFCCVSLLIHAGVAWRSERFHLDFPVIHTGEIEVALEAPPEPEPQIKEEEKQPEPEPEVKPEINREVPPAPVEPPSNERRTVRLPQPEDELSDPRQIEPPKIQPEEQVPVQPNVEPGGIDPDKEEKPLPLGLASRPRDDSLKMMRIAKSELPKTGGGSESSSPIPDGKNGLDAPEAPPEDILYNGGGAGGVNLPRAAPRLGGGGGNSILSVENPLARDAVPEDKPGIGPGLGGGEGVGAGGGVGFSRGRGIGTRPDGKDALATLKSKPGSGIGAGEGNRIGTNPPGGGTGTGSELPGTGGEGAGYGRGKGIGIGDGGGRGIVGLDRGIPFGDVSGLLKGDPDGGGGRGGGPGGPGRGAVFGARPTGGGSGRVHIVYVLDISGSMRRKIGKAQEALKQAISELKRTDTFNIILFARHPEVLAPNMLPATQENVLRAVNYIDEVNPRTLRDGTNISSAMEAALSLNNISHVFLMSDGEPIDGIRDTAQLRAFIKEMNTQKASILTLALIMDENGSGFQALKSIAADNNGTFRFVNLGRREDP